jgi:hypothetical protein
MAISPDGTELFFSAFLGDWVTIMHTRNTEGRWTEPVAATFSRDTMVNYCEPAFTPDGQNLLFLCTLPLDGDDPKPGWQDQNIWVVSKDENGEWTNLSPLPLIINQSDQFFPSVSSDGMFYFSKTDPGTSITSIYKSSWPIPEGKPKKLPEPVNGNFNTYNACISPDGLCLVACSLGRDTLNPKKNPSYYAFFREGNNWTEGINLDNVLQLDGSSAISPSFSPDGKYFFFATNKKRNETAFSNGEMNMTFFKERRNIPGNGNSDIYWIDASAIMNLQY